LTLLVQITDTHVVERDTLLYGMADTARHLAEAVSQINKSSNTSWEDLKDRMRGSMVVKTPR
jgi:hypothetical protein